jgi:hypothetical protein
MEFAVAKAKTQIEAVAETTFTTVLLNQYRDGKTATLVHADNEKN